MPTTPKNAKKPQDRKAKVEVKEEAVMRPEDVPGFNLLRPFSEVPVWDQTELLSLVDELMEEPDEESEDGEPREVKMKEFNKSVTIELIGRMGKALLPFALDPAEYTRFVSGREGFQRTIDLTLAWVGQMGEAEGSEDS